MFNIISISNYYMDRKSHFNTIKPYISWNDIRFVFTYTSTEEGFIICLSTSTFCHKHCYKIGDNQFQILLNIRSVLKRY